MKREGDILYLSQEEVKSLNLGLKEVIETMEYVFREQALGNTQNPPKPQLRPKEECFFHPLPAYIKNLGVAGLKWTCAYTTNRKEFNLPFAMGVVVLSRADNGAPLAIMDSAWITALRTAAVSAVTIKYLARKDSRVVGLVGLGLEGGTHIQAVKEVLPRVDLVKVYDRDRESQERFIHEVSTKTGLQIQGAGSPREVVEGSDVVITCTDFLLRANPVVEGSWIKEGILALPLEGAAYWKPEARRVMDKIITDDIAQTRYFAELGFFPNGVWGLPPFYCELADIVSGKKIGRENDRERIMGINLGLGLYDVALGKRAYDLALEKGIGTKLKM